MKQPMLSPTTSLVKMFGIILPAFALMVVPAKVKAGPTIPYPSPGTIAAPTYFTGTGADVVAYFFGDTAEYRSNMSMYVDGVQSAAGWVFPNHDTPFGASVDLGFAPAGSKVVFALQVFEFNPVTLATSPNPHYQGTAAYTLYSDPSLNTLDNTNHAYVTSYPGPSGNPTVPGVPAGTFVGFEDLLASESDFNYNDHTFVFTNISTDPTPEPATFTLLGIGIAGIAGYEWRKRKKAAYYR
jgi:hypothetical protein